MAHRVRFQGVAQFGHAALTPKRDVTQSDAACPLRLVSVGTCHMGANGEMAFADQNVMF